MSDRLASPDALIGALAADLEPVTRAWSPWRLAAVWLFGLALIAGGLARAANLHAFADRVTGAPDMGMAMIGAVLTAAAGVAVFLTAEPGRAAGWAWLPVPPLLLWIAASGAGCLRAWLAPGASIIPMGEMRGCLFFILALSVPLSGLTLLMLQRSWLVRPGLTTGLAGLAVAAAAASLLNLFHPYDASAMDLGVHAVAVAIVVGLNGVLASRFLAPTF